MGLDLRLAACALAASACAAPSGPASESFSQALARPALPCGTTAGIEVGLRALHASGSGTLSAVASSASDRDESNVAVLQDRGDLVVRRNPFDLDGAAVLFSPNGAGGYDVTRVAVSPGPVATPLGLGAGGAREVVLPFDFPYFGTKRSRIAVQSDGSITFDEADAGTAAPDLGRFLSGPPRIAAFFADLDPGRGGSVSIDLQPDAARVLWSDVPGAGQSNRNTFEVVLRAEGTVQMAWAALETREGIVGLSSGRADGLVAADLSRGRPAGSAGPLAERFSETEKADLVSVAHRFLRSHPDEFEQLVVYTTRPLNPAPGTLAFEVNTKNAIAGIGLPVNLDQSAAWGSDGVLASVVYMDAIDPYLVVDGFEILGHEVGHRWLTRAAFRDAAGLSSNALLGRGLAHWSFFFDSDASVLEGNDIVPVGGGRFATVDIARGYCALDQYLMGLRPAEEVPDFFYVDEPDDFHPDRAFKFSSGPEVGVSFTGIRRDVRVSQVVAALGARVPAASQAPRLLRQAFVLVADDTAAATPERVRAVARIRERFRGWYEVATDGLGEVDSTLP